MDPLAKNSDNPEEFAKTIGVIGAGLFGTALAEISARAGNKVKIFARNKEVVESINVHHKNCVYLSSYELHPNIVAVDTAEAALTDVDFVILAIPTQSVPGWLAEHKHLIPDDLLLCNSAKGLYLQENCLLSDAVMRVLGRDQPYAIISGPSFAQEMMDNYPTAVVVASKYLYHAVTVQRALTTLHFRCYTTQDIIGVQLGGALKNPLAIGAGVIEGMGMGINTMAAYITRSSLELQTLCKAMGGEPQTISGLSGVGDLILTAFGALSRNRTLGIQLSKGVKLEDVTSHMTVEGVPTAKVAVEFGRRCGLDLPIFNAVAAIINGELKIEDAHVHLMGRPIF